MWTSVSRNIYKQTIHIGKMYVYLSMTNSTLLLSDKYV